jgi:hypothetical protein
VLTSAIRIHRLGEVDVRRIVARDHAARAFLGDFRARTWTLFIEHRVLPAIVFGLMPNGLEASLRIGSGSATFECVWKIDHLPMMRARDLIHRDT